MQSNTSKDFHYYFAYGSNMDLLQMKKRCKEHIVVGTAFLKDYELCFPRFSTTRNGGVASIAEKRGSIVWGVLFQLSDKDISALDKFEGVPSVYGKINIAVTTLDHQEFKAFSYIAIAQTGVHKPSEEYLYIIIHALKARGDIPNEYIEKISEIECL